VTTEGTHDNINFSKLLKQFYILKETKIFFQDISPYSFEVKSDIINYLKNIELTPLIQRLKISKTLEQEGRPCDILIIYPYFTINESEVVNLEKDYSVIKNTIRDSLYYSTRDSGLYLFTKDSYSMADNLVFNLDKTRLLGGKKNELIERLFSQRTSKDLDALLYCVDDQFNWADIFQYFIDNFNNKSKKIKKRIIEFCQKFILEYNINYVIKDRKKIVRFLKKNIFPVIDSTLVEDQKKIFYKKWNIYLIATKIQ